MEAASFGHHLTASPGRKKGNQTDDTGKQI
jgi:hypothetical protein